MNICRWCGRDGPGVWKTYQEGPEATDTAESWVCTADGETYDAAGCKERMGV